MPTLYTPRYNPAGSKERDDSPPALVHRFLNPGPGTVHYLDDGETIRISMIYALSILGLENFDNTVVDRRRTLREDTGIAAELLRHGLPERVVEWLCDHTGADTLDMPLDEFIDQSIVEMTVEVGSEGGAVSAGSAETANTDSS